MGLSSYRGSGSQIERLAAVYKGQSIAYCSLSGQYRCDFQWEGERMGKRATSEPTKKSRRTSIPQRSSNRVACHVVSVGKRRDGGTRYWCLLHRADATAKYGRPAKSCRY